MEHDLRPFDYRLPKRLIAQTPAHPRDHARLLVYNRADGQIIDDYFYNLADYLWPNTTVVLNNSQVDKARLKFEQFEVFVTSERTPRVITALVFPGKRFKPGTMVALAEGITARVTEALDDGQRVLELSVSAHDPRLNKYRQTPFPPYIQPDEALAEDYQTVYARQHGSLAAPTAGLHFTEEGLKVIKQRWPVAEVTLHVGLGTFAPLKASHLASGQLHAEWYQIDTTAAKLLNQARHITAVGTTSARVLESAATAKRRFTPRAAKTQLFIRNGYKFKAVDSLITNFHLPKSSLLMLVGAFMGVEAMHAAYKHAIDNKYRFYSFGDAMLII